MPAWADACVTAPVFPPAPPMPNVPMAYTTPNFSCSVGDKTFSDIMVTGTATGNAFVTLDNISPFMSGNEFGLQLNLSAVSGPSGQVSITWNYTVESATPMIDAFLDIESTSAGAGTFVGWTEVLSNEVGLVQIAPADPATATNVATFEPIIKLDV